MVDPKTGNTFPSGEEAEVDGQELTGKSKRRRIVDTSRLRSRNTSTDTEPEREKESLPEWMQETLQVIPLFIEKKLRSE